MVHTAEGSICPRDTRGVVTQNTQPPQASPADCLWPVSVSQIPAVSDDMSFNLYKPVPQELPFFTGCHNTTARPLKSLRVGCTTLDVETSLLYVFFCLDSANKEESRTYGGKTTMPTFYLLRLFSLLFHSPLFPKWPVWIKGALPAPISAPQQPWEVGQAEKHPHWLKATQRTSRLSRTATYRPARPLRFSLQEVTARFLL